MAKDRLLDTCYKTCAIIFSIIFLSSCSLPKIIILNDPLTPEEHINLGMSYEQKGEYDPALKQYEIAAEKLPIAYLYLGNLYFSRSEFDKAEASYKKAVEKTGAPETYNNLAWLYYSTGKNIKEAEELAEKAVTLAPESADFKDTLNKIREKMAGQ